MALLVTKIDSIIVPAMLGYANKSRIDRSAIGIVST